jgi:hypothetical protein
MTERKHPVRDQGLIVTCEAGHQQTIYLPDHGRAEATQLGQVMDGTSPLFMTSPRNDPESTLARCAFPCDSLVGRIAGQSTCNTLIRAEPFGYEAPA